MTKQRVQRTSRRHAGVRVMTLSDGRNVARWNDPHTGKLRQESLDRLGLTTQRRREQWACQKADELKALRLASSLAHSTPEPVTIENALEAYAKAKRVSERTALARKPALDDLKAYCAETGIKRVNQLTYPKLEPWRLRVVADESRMVSTRNLWLATVGAFLRWACDSDRAPLLPPKKVDSLTGRIEEPASPVQVLRPAELRKVLEACIRADEQLVYGQRPTAAFVMTLALTGMRFSEVAGLDWGEVGGGKIQLPATRTKTKSDREVTLEESPTLAKLLGAMRCGREGGLVFSPRWLPQSWRRYEHRLIKASGVAFTPRVLRRTCGSILANAPSIAGSASVWVAASRLGHTIQVAQKYYYKRLTDLPADAKTIEDAAGIRDLCEAIVAAAARG